MKRLEAGQVYVRGNDGNLQRTLAPTPSIASFSYKVVPYVSTCSELSSVGKTATCYGKMEESGSKAFTNSGKAFDYVMSMSADDYDDVWDNYSLLKTLSVNAAKGSYPKVFKPLFPISPSCVCVCSTP